MDLAAERQPDDTPAVDWIAVSDERFAEQLIDRHQPRVARLVGRLLGWSAALEDIEDIVQEVLVAAIEGRRRFQGRCRFDTWLTSIAINKCRTHRRKRWIRRRLFRVWAEKQTPATDRPADELTLSHDEADRVRAAVSDLPEKYREVIVLHYLEELTVAEIVSALNSSRGAVEVRLSRARKQLAARLTTRKFCKDLS